MPNRRKDKDLKVVEGTFNTSRDQQEPLETTGRPEKPKHVTGLAGRIWREVVDKLPWLGEADSYTFALWCQLEAEFREVGVQRIDTSRIIQYRTLSNDLGMSPGGRSKLDTKGKGPRKGKGGASKYVT